jgi:hypothetical protein
VREGSFFPFDAAGALVGKYATQTDAMHAIPPHRTRLNLAKQADVILKRARYDTMTGAKKDRHCRRNKRAERKRFARHWRAKRKKLGKFGPALPVRVIEPEEVGAKD